MWSRCGKTGFNISCSRRDLIFVISFTQQDFLWEIWGRDITRNSSPAFSWFSEPCFSERVGPLAIGSLSPSDVVSKTPLDLLRVLEENLHLGLLCLEAHKPAALPAFLVSTRERDSPHLTQSEHLSRSIWRLSLKICKSTKRSDEKNTLELEKIQDRKKYKIEKIPWLHFLCSFLTLAGSHL